MKYVHVGINVKNLKASIEFYQKLFNIKPVKVKKDYAKFLLEKPGLNFTLNVRDKVSGNQVNHFGFQVDSTEEVEQHKVRLKEMGLLPTLEEEDTICCYARQDKFWVKDPDGNEWEFFCAKEDTEVRKGDTTCCSTTATIEVKNQESYCCTK
ncbi:glyoxalase/bleomycin resistance/dioxygenase family protein [Bacillus methanolicus]|uniref:ArsI/CadI family heavy metal resistance metalloenzyme n=1 Tax=Bacillus methanolicus TaxID=1471 RepID=UPI00200EE264|nr:ArsI/CadI family heavy metal resistance metalloenzyme [Bacillus methanolicus]UQD50978.1 glyoxalase/bleomycin resistance/dioxygenase family protein [Bacillus methanolicus]